MAEPISARSFRTIIIAALAVAVVAIVLIWWGRSSDLANSRDTRAATAERGPRIHVANVTQGPAVKAVTLLGDVRAYQTATLYAKVAGYLKTVNVDRGDKVTAGEVLAQIESPETDHQYASAVADLENKRKIAERNQALLARGNVAVQTADQANTDVRTADATAGQLGALRGYEELRAPFAGTVTARFADPGALLQNAASSQTSSLPVLTIADSSRLRVDVYVQQENVPLVHVGDPVDVVDASNPDRKITATISRTAGELDPQTRTLFVEIDVDNQNNFLVAGSFAYVTLHLPVKSYLRIPATALLIRSNGSFVATVGADGTVHFQPVKVNATDGTFIDIADGLKPGERVAINVPDEVSDGSKIQPVTLTAAAPQ